MTTGDRIKVSEAPLNSVIGFTKWDRPVERWDSIGTVIAKDHEERTSRVGFPSGEIKTYFWDSENPEVKFMCQD